MTTTDTSEN